MRNGLALLVSLVFLTACGGGAGGGGGSTSPTGSTIPYGSVSGKAFDGLILNGTVSVYDFSTGAKGALLGQATTDSTGLYSLSLQVESRPVLLELTGGYYVEEAGTAGFPTQVALSSGQKLTALDNYTTSGTLSISVTTYTHLAAGLAAYEIKKGVAVSAAINDANNRVSSLAGINILTTTPKEITDVANASAFLTPELRYGFLAGAISMWTYNNTPNLTTNPTPGRVSPYTSIDFAQLLYQDISADGLLDGIGLDSAGNVTPMSFGTIPLGVNVYRQAIGAAIVQMAGDPNNKTGLTGAQVLSFASAYISNTDAMFNGVPPTTFAPSSVVIFSPSPDAWARKTVNLTSTAFSPFGLKTVELLVDGASVATSQTLSTQSFPVDTTGHADGQHTFNVRATDLGGFVTTASVQLKIDNTPPTSTGGFTPLPFPPMTYGPVPVFGTASDNYSGVSSVTASISPSGTLPISAGTNWSTSVPPTDNFSAIQYQINDAAGNCSIYKFVLPTSSSPLAVWTLVNTCS